MDTHYTPPSLANVRRKPKRVWAPKKRDAYLPGWGNAHALAEAKYRYGYPA